MNSTAINSRSVIARGLPYIIGKKEIREYFKNHDNVTDENIFIEQWGGRRTGRALIILKDKKTAREAKRDLNEKNMQSQDKERYIEIIDHNDTPFKIIADTGKQSDNLIEYITPKS